MPNWKELGEVPDSDDDYDELPLDIDEIDCLPIIDLPVEQKDGDVPNRQDATVGQTGGGDGREEESQKQEQKVDEGTRDSRWPEKARTKQGRPQRDPYEIPSSPDEPLATRKATKIFIPLPAASQRDDGLGSVGLGSDDLAYKSQLVPSERPASSVPANTSSPPKLSTQSLPLPTQRHDGPNCPAGNDAADKTSSPARQCSDAAPSDFLQDGIFTSYVRVTTPTRPPRSASSSPLSLLAKTPSPPCASPSRQQRRPSPPAERPILQPSEDDVIRKTIVRAERSLRPRKPIQEHPYLIEKERYRKVMKSHGLKPIEVLPESPKSRKKTREEDSQEEEFRADESQESPDNGLPADETAPILFGNNILEEDELTMSSPVDRQLKTSSRQASADHTDDTSLSDEDLPPLGKIKPQKQTQRRLKRYSSGQLMSSTRKRARLVVDSSSPPPPPGRTKTAGAASRDLWDLPSSPPPVWSRPQNPLQHIADLLSSSPSRNQTGVEPQAGQLSDEDTPRHSRRGTQGAPIVIHDHDPQEDLTGSDSDSSHSSDSDSDVVRRESRRLRGLLPASWLRLDRRQNQQQEKEKQTTSRHVRRRSSELPTKRKGVALPRQASPKPPSSTAPFPIFADDDLDDASDTPPATSGSGLGTIQRPLSTAPETIVIDDEDPGSDVMEEDIIDWMPPSANRKRSGSRTLSHLAKRRKGDGLRQPKITQVLGRSTKQASSTRPKGDSTHHRVPRKKRENTPPMLSILDVVEPNAPHFIRIAARTARKKANLGKSSPSKKIICLATRSDNIVALSVLRDWKSGKTKPRVSVPSQPRKPKDRPALHEVSTNTAPRSRLFPTRKQADQATLDGFVTVRPEEGGEAVEAPRETARRLFIRKKVPNPGPIFLPAQLEEEETEDKRLSRARKRTLDAFYKRSRRVLGSAAEVLSRPLDTNFTLREESLRVGVPRPQDDAVDIVDEEDDPIPAPAPRQRQAKSRFRKRTHPHQINTDAPQYTRANDPLPVEPPPPVVLTAEVRNEPRSEDKLRGLGPYGTHYTHHFDIFPFDNDKGIFFHESTFIGQGYIRDAADPVLCEKVRRPRASVAFTLDGEVLKWGAWDDRVSSELGILVDWVGEQMGSPEELGRGVVEAAGFVVRYLTRSLSISSDADGKGVLGRCLEVFGSFVGRFEGVEWGALAEGNKRVLLDVGVRYLVAILAARTLSTADWINDFSLAMGFEEMLKKLARIVIERLLERGTDELRTLYDDLQGISVREGGIRSNRLLANWWVVLIRVLESAAIPRSSFWDLTQSVMLRDHDISHSTDAQLFERLWLDMFTLLPLTEIDNTGLHIPDQRKSLPLEGWTLPQQLLKRVLELSKANPRQPPGFNDYCRALVARCHVLVQEWGWRRCTGVIGTIFDFFGAQNLAHLRNEETNASPRFLEMLERNPVAAVRRIDPAEDRCAFHIFIKLLALAIVRLRELGGRERDIRNLVARTLPNHDRQLLKEDTVHRTDLAALRNHHDLLCALFWAAPPDSRPGIHHIEKLVVPGSAHKEACLINVRAWNQLARFVICHETGPTAPRTGVVAQLAAWRSNIFNQILDQYLSAASDIEQQFRMLSADVLLRVSEEVKEETIAKNKASAMEILHAILRASVDVLRLAPGMEEALAEFNASHVLLQKVFTTLDYEHPRFDWKIVREALDMLEHFIGRIDQAVEQQYSSNFSQNPDADRHVEEAVLLLDSRLAKEFFWMARTILKLTIEKLPREGSMQAQCAEKTVTLAGRIAARLIHHSVTKMSPYFSPGTYGLFSAPPKALTTAERTYLPLFLAVLVKNDVFDFRDLGMNILSLWLLTITKPARLLRYENYLAEALQHHHLPFLAGVTVPVTLAPDYSTNIDYLSSALHHMRKALRDAPNPGQAKVLREEFSRHLGLVMQKMREDLSLLRSLSSIEHVAYISFIRSAISLLKSLGVGICVIDPFFTQPSADYAPPMHDPTLHAAGIVAYGVRLAERDVTAAPQLFHYLFSSFRLALGNGLGMLRREEGIIARAVGEDRWVRGFILGTWVPAILGALEVRGGGLGGWVVLEVCVGALGEAFGEGEEIIGDEEEAKTVNGLLEGIMGWFVNVRRAFSLESPPPLGSDPELTILMLLHVMALLGELTNLLQPSLRAFLVNEAEVAASLGLNDIVRSLARLFSFMKTQLDNLLSQFPASRVPVQLGPPDLAAAALVEYLVPEDITIPGNGNTAKVSKIQNFSKTIVSEVKKNWVVTNGAVMVRMPATATAGGAVPPSAQAAVGLPSSPSLQGMRYEPWKLQELLERMREVTSRWKLGVEVEWRRGRKKIVCAGGLEGEMSAYF